MKGDSGESLLRLKHAWDRYESQLFFVSTEDKIEQAKEKYMVELCMTWLTNNNVEMQLVYVFV